jgi:mannitol/fructose-specific phosphotransferase system IIA component (Ntr-type)
MIWDSLTRFKKENVDNSKEALKKILDWNEKTSEFDYFVEREKKYSFGIGKGVVLYQKQREGEDAELSILIANIPVKYDSFDGVPISIFCFLSSFKDEDLHLKYLSRFYRLMNFATFRDNLVNLSSKEEAKKLIKREEESFEE